jgi:hypothetical protein
MSYVAAFRRYSPLFELLVLAYIILLSYESGDLSSKSWVGASSILEVELSEHSLLRQNCCGNLEYEEYADNGRVKCRLESSHKIQQTATRNNLKTPKQGIVSNDLVPPNCFLYHVIW